jgi:radical SAM superfamily enzyme YgiQ (UPF0313 family)
MKVALIVPGSKAGVSNPRYRELFPHLLPMSAAYLGAVLEKGGHDVVIIDQIARRLSNADLVEVLRREQVDVAGISLLTTTVSNVLDLVPRIRRELPRVRIVMGNHHASLFAQDLLANGAADLIVRGEGETTLLETVNALEGGDGLEKGDLGKIRGLSFRCDGEVIHNPQRPVIADLDSLPTPAWHLVDLFNPAYMNLPIIGVYSTPLSVMASRGCPFHCVFCSQDTQYKKVRLRDTLKVVDEIEELVDRHRFEWFSFNDAYFPWTRKQGFEFADELIRRGLHKRVRWITESRVDMVDDELMRRLRESGLSVIFFGFESGNQRVLDLAGKRTTLAQAKKAAQAARKAGVLIMGFFMLGLPGDTVESCWDTVNFAIDLDCDFAKFAVTVPYPGSALFDQQKGRIDASQFEKFTSWYDWASGDEALLYAPEGMTVQELLSIQRAGMLKFYARPSQVWRHLSRGTIRPGPMLTGATVLLEGALKDVVRKVRRAVGSRG